MEMLLEIRDDARKRKDWDISDDIRKELENIGFEIQDTSKGSNWRKKQIIKKNANMIKKQLKPTQ